MEKPAVKQPQNNQMCQHCGIVPATNTLDYSTAEYKNCHFFLCAMCTRIVHDILPYGTVYTIHHGVKHHA